VRDWGTDETAQRNWTQHGFLEIAELGARLTARLLSPVELCQALRRRCQRLEPLLAVAHAYQEATDWRRRRPPLAA